jgi:hypothetical protein
MPSMTPWADRSSIMGIPIRPAVSKVASDSSNSDDYRSVIDDLTIENKKLKQKLRKFEKLHASHMDEEKLFEVKIHGLPASQQAALEEALRTFAAGLHIPTDRTAPATGAANSRKLTAGNLLTSKASASSTSGSRPLDSAYASMSASAVASSLPSGLAAREEARHDQPSEKAKKQKVQSYLHDIPEGLRPRQAPLMTENSKKKLVVRRLEQLFTGKAPEGGDRSQPLQQQEVSQSAAHADRTAKRASGIFIAHEGTREAHILPSPGVNTFTDVEAPDPNLTSLLAILHSNDHGSQRESRTSASGGDESPDQRPTRPLDLDLQRAQNPADNMEYIRHLGLSSPKLSPGSIDLRQDEGWIYLNLLTNMAQLHTINVTPEFVRKAVAEVSDKFELSLDGRKVRWREDHDGTKLSSDGGSSGHNGGSSTEEHAEATAQANKRRKLENRRSSLPDPTVRFESPEVTSKPVHRSGPRRPAMSKDTRSSSMHYRPIFYQQSESSEKDDSYHRESDSPTSSTPFDRVPHKPSRSKGVSGSKSARSGTKRAAGGSMIFYRNSSFCTDLGGRRTNIATPASLPRPSSDAIGLPPKSDRPESIGRLQISFEESSRSEEEMEVDNGSSERVEASRAAAFHFSPSLGPVTSQVSTPVPFDLEASGIGGVISTDNFAINVSTSHPILSKSSAALSPFSAPRSRVRKCHHSIPESAISAFHHEPSGYAPITSSIVSEEHIPLQPSDLPPPSFAFFPSSGDDDDDDDIGSVDSASSSGSSSSASGSLDRHAASPMGPPARPSKLRGLLSSAGTGSLSMPVTATTQTGGITDDSSEIDLLAPARALDPEGVARHELEFDSSLDMRFSKDLPAGSSAATAGGGSGWASEYDGSQVDDSVGDLSAAQDRWCNPWGAVAGPVRMDCD